MLQVTMMAPAVSDGSNCPADVLIVEDDPIIAIDFEDRLLGFGVKSVRTVGSGAGADRNRGACPRIRLARRGIKSREQFCGRRTARGPEDSLRLRHRLRR